MLGFPGFSAASITETDPWLVPAKKMYVLFDKGHLADHDNMWTVEGVKNTEILMT